MKLGVAEVVMISGNIHHFNGICLNFVEHLGKLSWMGGVSTYVFAPTKGANVIESYFHVFRQYSDMVSMEFCINIGENEIRSSRYAIHYIRKAIKSKKSCDVNHAVRS